MVPQMQVHFSPCDVDPKPHIYAVFAFSLMCAKCSSSSVVGWALDLFLNLFPITAFYIFVILFNIRVTAPPFTAFVLMCQIYCIM